MFQAAQQSLGGGGGSPWQCDYGHDNNAILPPQSHFASRSVYLFIDSVVVAPDVVSTNKSGDEGVELEPACLRLL